jgi:hypothetical protein
MTVYMNAYTRAGRALPLDHCRAGRSPAARKPQSHRVSRTACWSGADLVYLIIPTFITLSIHHYGSDLVHAHTLALRRLVLLSKLLACMGRKGHMTLTRCAYMLGFCNHITSCAGHGLVSRACLLACLACAWLALACLHGLVSRACREDVRGAARTQARSDSGGRAGQAAAALRVTLRAPRRTRSAGAPRQRPGLLLCLPGSSLTAHVPSASRVPRRPAAIP